MRALLAACALSLAIYVACAALLLDRPLTHGALLGELEAKLARGAAIKAPKLVILAGSNGPYSHRCEAMEPVLGRACVNAGVAVGIGLDYLFARWDALLRPGDAVYLPMEPAQYTRRRLANATGPDAAIMARHDRATLAALGPERWLGAALPLDLRGVAMSAIEMALHAAGFRDPRPDGGGTNAWGDHVGHDAARAASNAAALAAMTVPRPDAVHMRDGHGAALIAAFTRRMTARGVTVIGGLSVGFDDAPLSDAAIAAMATVYTGNGGAFLALDNRSRYPRAWFFDGPEHLSEPYQILHARKVAAALAERLSERFAGLP
jgi:hypothetical protein